MESMSLRIVYTKCTYDLMQEVAKAATKPAAVEKPEEQIVIEID